MAMTISGTSGLTFPNASTQPAAAPNNAAVNAVGSSPVTLTASSAQYQIIQINSYANSYVTLPDATTMAKGFAGFIIENLSPIGANISIQNTAGTVVGYLSVSSIGYVYLRDSSTSAGVWEITKTVAQDAIFSFDANSITTVASAYLGVVGLSSTLFVRYNIVVTGEFTFTLYTQAATISGSTITLGSIQSVATSVTPSFPTYNSSAYYLVELIRLSNTAFIVSAGYSAMSLDINTNQWNHVGNKSVRVCTVAGTTVTFGTASNASYPSWNVSNASSALVDAVASAGMYNGGVCRLSDTSFAIVYNDGLTTTYLYPNNYSGSLSCQIITVSGTTLTIGTKVTLATSTYTQALALAALTSTSLFVGYGQGTAGSSTGRTKMNVVSISGTVPTWGTSVNVEAADTTVQTSNAGTDYAVAPSSTQVIFNTAYSTAVASVSGTTPTFVGTGASLRLGKLYLCTASKAYAPQAPSSGKAYLDINASGFVYKPNYVFTIQTNVTLTPTIASPLGAQPTTAFVAYDNTNLKVVLGSTT